MVTEDYVSFETAKLLKEKGFDANLLVCYTPDGLFSRSYGIKTYTNESEDSAVGCICPTLQMAMKWLREKHGLFINLYPEFGDVEIAWNPGDFEEDMIGYKITIIDLNYGELKYKTLIKHNYEEACEAGIKYCLENLI